MMFDDDRVGPIHSMDFSSSLNFLEFDGSILEYWNDLADDEPPFGTNNEPICTYSKPALVKEDEHGPNKTTRVSKRGPSKGDRHSKIPTIRGLRDRRIRLSLDVARQFFKLQDMLSYDRPSKTVKWLLLQAGPAIEELDKGKGSFFTGATKIVLSNCSEREDVESAIDRHEDTLKAAAKTTTFEKKEEKKRRNFDVAKEMRKEARERARERTMMKKQALGDFGNYDTKSCSSNVVFEVEKQFQDELLTHNWSSLVSLSYHQENDPSCKVNPISESQQVHPNLEQYWFY